MYKFVDDTKFLKESKSFCSKIISELVETLKDDYSINTKFCKIGSGAKNLITQNGSGDIDFDYNIEILHCKDGNYKPKEIKEKIKKTFNKVLNKNGLQDCKDSTSSLTVKNIKLDYKNKPYFSIDLGIIIEWDDGTVSRLIHKKTGNTNYDNWEWNTATRSLEKIKNKIKKLKKDGCWEILRQTYLDKKNLYLKRNDFNHPSYICYIEAVNEVYNKNINGFYD
ncbi:hypothetical protein [Mesoplasma melaleucae]|uniref:Nucleotidyltransferase n=1 Tax=Mesoplasma melaleucae TaxID=81459 RepID=A0A2K8NVB6_9MOLU|nr:hypothetical protein [Mesoplasma melaleucae]ATZ17782.1 hypothetical protein EMELA_v1c02090 [Mesoplasma melaleucae]